TGMQRAEGGELGARVSVGGGGEFAFLAGSLNRMLARIEDLTSGLESRVRQATGALADKNTELEEANEKLWRAQLEVGRSGRLAGPADLPAVPGDAVALRQVLINLLANAVDATEPPGTITVAAHVLGANGRGRQLEVTIADTGHGMETDEARRVFEPFYTTKA